MTGMLLAAFLLAFQDPKPEKLPEPAAESLRDAERIIKLHYKADYARRKPEELRAFSRALVTAARDPMNDMASRYVLLREAREIGIQAGDPRAVVDAIDELARFFVVDASALRKESVMKIAPPKAADDAHAMADVCLSLLDEALDAGQFETAAGFGEKAEGAARNAKDAGLLSHAQAASKEAAETLKQYLKIKPLMQKADDPASSLEVGRFWCFTREAWEEGLPFLAKGSDEKLKDLAARELSKPVPALRIEIAETWLELAGQERGTAKASLQRHALRNYEIGLMAVTGPGRAKLEARMEGLYGELAGTMSRAGLVFWVEPGRSAADPFRDLASNSKPTNQGTTVSDAGGVKSLAFAKTLVQYDCPIPVQAMDRVGSMFAWVKTDNPAHWGGIVDRGHLEKPNDVDDVALFVNQGYVEFWMNWPARRARIGRSKDTIVAGKWTLIGVTWDERKLSFYIDGKDQGSVAMPESPLRRSSRIQVGANPPGGTEWYNGLIGAVMVYNRPLTPSDAMGLYSSTRNRFR
jgi:hypothetical protein